MYYLQMRQYNPPDYRWVHVYPTGYTEVTNFSKLIDPAYKPFRRSYPSKAAALCDWATAKVIFQTEDISNLHETNPELFL